MAYIAYITVYRGTGRPERALVREVPDTVAADGEASALEYADPMSAYIGARVVGIYHEWDEADFRCQFAWDELTTVDEAGYTQWR